MRTKLCYTCHLYDMYTHTCKGDAFDREECQNGTIDPKEDESWQ